MAEADAWYSGLEARLISFYGGPTAKAPDSQGRIASTFASFWSRRAADEHTGRQRLHIPVAASVAATSADLLFGDAIRLRSEHTATQERLDELDELNRLDSLLLEAADVAAGIGGVYLRAGWDRELQSDGPILDVVHADRAVPTFRRGRLVDVTFWREVTTDEKGKVWRHLEHHAPGVIVHRLYLGDKGHIGRSVPLRELPETAALIGMDGADDQGVIRLPPPLETQLAVASLPNMLPNKRHRGWPVGVSDTLGAVDVMDAIDETETSWMRDIRLGKNRIIVPQEFLERRGRGKGAHFDMDAEVFSPLEMDPASQAKATIEQFLPMIRHESHQSTLAQQMEYVVTSAGYSPSTFGLIGDIGVVQTATEISARTDRTNHTIGRKKGYARPAVGHTGGVMLALGRALFGWTDVNLDEKVTVEWPRTDSDPHRTAETVDLLRRAEAASTRKLVELAFPDLEGDDLDEEVALIVAESGRLVEDPTGRPEPPNPPPDEGATGGGDGE